LVDALVERGARVRVVDNLSGRLENLEAHFADAEIEFHNDDLLDSRVAEAMVRDIEVVFHNAADHGGRGYIDLHQVNCSTNLILEGRSSARRSGRASKRWCSRRRAASIPRISRRIPTRSSTSPKTS
jgi:hypothetical protein